MAQRLMHLAMLAMACAGQLAGCGRGTEERPPTSAQPPSAPVAREDSPVPTVVFDPDGRAAAVAVELARTPRQIQRGLMYREHLPPDRGMLFLFPDGDRVRSFWMKNTLIPLDMIFVSSSMEVVGVVENAEPRTTTSRTVGLPSQFVIEVNAGWASKEGVTAGTKVRFDHVDRP